MTIDTPRAQSPATAPETSAEDLAAPDSASAGTTKDEPQKKGLPLNVAGLVAGAATAATMAVIGGHLSVIGTVLGAALTSIVSGLAIAVYSASLEKSRHGLKKVHATVAGRVRSRPGRGAPDSDGSTPVAGGSRWSGLRPRLKPFLVSTGAVIGLAVAGIFGVQALTGTELSSGTGQIQRSVTGQDSIAVRTADVPAPGTPVGEDPAGITPADAGTPPAGAPTAGPAPEEVTPTDGAVGVTGTTPGGALPDAGAQPPAGGEIGTDGGGAGSGTRQGAGGTDAGAVPAAP